MTSKKVDRPWGSYESLVLGDGFQVKFINVNPKASLSLQRHKFRSEHWVVVAGTATVVLGEETQQFPKNHSIFIPRGVLHRLSNNTKEPLQLVEVQSGTYLGEDDIERFDDEYGRA